MSAFLDEERAPLSPAAILARLLNVDLATAALALQGLTPTNRPAGMQLLGAVTIQDAKAILGMSVPSTVKVDAYTFGR